MSFFKAIRANLECWLSLVVYIWGLEFQAIIGLGDPEPLYAEFLDCAAILLTLAFWGIAASVAVACGAIVFARADGANFSRLVCKVGVVVSTGLFLGRWLNNWTFLTANDTLITWILGAICVVLAVVAMVRRRRKPDAPSANFPSFEDCFRFGALPVLVLAVSLVWFQIIQYSTQSPVSKQSRIGVTIQNKDNNLPNIILIVADGLRAQSMSLYGYHRQTTPNLDKLAAHANVYTRAYSNVTATQASLTTLLTGKHPLTHGRVSRYQPPYDSDENLLKILRDNGYTTAAVTTNWDASFLALGLSQYLSTRELKQFQLFTLHQLKDFGIPATRVGNRMFHDFYNGIRHYLELPLIAQSYEPAEVTLDATAALVATLKQPFFLFIHITEPHDPYYPSPKFKGIYSSEESTRLQSRTVTFHDYFDPDAQPVVDAYRDRYDETIAYLDDAMGKFVKALKHTFEGKQLFLIFTSDHGESFEHDYLSHGEDLHDPSTRIPLIIQWPSQKRPRTMNRRVQFTDIAPTILQTAGISIPAWMDGQSLSLEAEPSVVDVVAINHRWPSGTEIPNLPNQLAIWSQHYKMIVHCDKQKIELFDLFTDKTETTDVSGKQPGKLEDLKRRLQQCLRREEHGKSLRSCVDKLT